MKKLPTVEHDILVGNERLVPKWMLTEYCLCRKTLTSEMEKKTRKSTIRKHFKSVFGKCVRDQ